MSARGRSSRWPAIAYRAVSALARAISAWPGGVQGRLGPRRPHSVGRPGLWTAATVHLGGTLAEIVATEDDVQQGRHPERPFVLVAQQSLFDPTRAPAGMQTGWAYCHVPNGSTIDLTERIEAQVERFAPGFRDRILDRHTMLPAAMEAHDANFIGGDINGGAADLRQFVGRPRRGSIRGELRWKGSTSVRRQPLPAAASTACAACTPPTRCYAGTVE